MVFFKKINGILHRQNGQGLRDRRTDVNLNIAGIQRMQDQTTKNSITIEGLRSKVHSIETFTQSLISVVNTTYDYKEFQTKHQSTMCPLKQRSQINRNWLDKCLKMQQTLE